MRKANKIIWIAVFSASVFLNIYFLRSNVHNYLASISGREEVSKKNTNIQTDRGAPGTDKSGKGTNSDVTPGITGKTSGRLNFSILDSLSNEKKSWGLPGNSEHKPPEVPSGTSSLLDKYNGIYLGDTASNNIYLTFDEGYENGYTPKILDILKKNKVKTIFFVTEAYVRKNPDLVRRMLEEGHKVGSHTVTHPSLPEVSNESLEKELAGFDDNFYSEYKYHFQYLRPPNGEYSERTLEAARELGYKTVFWSFSYLDYDVNNQKGADNAYNRVMGNLHKGAVILLHAVSRDNAEALDRIIKGIKKEGYNLSPFDL